MSPVTWFVIILISFLFLGGLAYIVRAIVAIIRLPHAEKSEEIEILKDRYERGEISPDEYRDRMRIIE